MKAALFFASSLLMASTAYAADTFVEGVPASGWSGFYAGGQIGYGFSGDSGVFEMDRNLDGRFDGNGVASPDYIAAFDRNAAGPCNAAPGPDDCKFYGDFNDGLTGGVHVGYDWQAGSLVYGVLADFNITNIGDEQSANSGTPAFYTIERDLDYLASLRARFGYAINDRFMAYATGGLALGDVDYSFRSNTPAVAVVSDDDSYDLGYSVGGGVVAKVTQRVSIGAEYLYTNLGKDDFNVNLSGPAAFSAIAGSTNARGSDRNFDFHTVQMKVSYHF